MRSFLRSAMFAMALAGPLLIPATASAFLSVDITVGTPPPPLPVYEQPLAPGDGYIWTPGYWAWDGDDYYWVPGTWVIAPTPGYLWTPAWWGFDDGFYRWHPGYWGPHVGFYGGINYGHGYGGRGYDGGRWERGQFYYNRSVNNINVTNIHNTYNTTVVVNNSSRVSYNGGNGGLSTRPTSQDMAASRDRHIDATHEQQTHQQSARSNPALMYKANGGRPETAAMQRPGSGPSGNRGGAQAQDRGDNDRHGQFENRAGVDGAPQRGSNPAAGNERGVDRGPQNRQAQPFQQQQQRAAQPNTQPATRPNAQPQNGNPGSDRGFRQQQQQAGQNQRAQQQQQQFQQFQQRQQQQQQQRMQQQRMQQQQVRPQPQMQQRPQQQMPQRQAPQQMQQRQAAPQPQRQGPPQGGGGHEGGGHHEGH